MKTVLVIGPGGAGKSTVSRRLGNIIWLRSRREVDSFLAKLNSRETFNA